MAGTNQYQSAITTSPPAQTIGLSSGAITNQSLPPSQGLPVIAATDDVPGGGGGMFGILLFVIIGAAMYYWAKNRSKYVVSSLSNREGYQRLSYGNDSVVSKKN